MSSFLGGKTMWLLIPRHAGFGQQLLHLVFKLLAHQITSAIRRARVFIPRTPMDVREMVAGVVLSSQLSSVLSKTRAECRRADKLKRNTKVTRSILRHTPPFFAYPRETNELRENGWCQRETKGLGWWWPAAWDQ